MGDMTSRDNQSEYFFFTRSTGRPENKKVTVLEAAHNHVFNYRLFKLSGVVPDIIRFYHMTLFLMSDVWSLSCILSNENAKI